MSKLEDRLRIIAWMLRVCIIFLMTAFAIFLWLLFDKWHAKQELVSGIPAKSERQGSSYVWMPPDSTQLSAADNDLILYGRELIAHTAIYFGPKGKVEKLSNGMNCQNCHLRAGQQVFGNNFSAVASTYPKFRARSGTVESVEKRINDCFERSLNGHPLKNDSKEMKALVAYIQWVGHEVPKKVVPVGAGILELPLLGRAADPVQGENIYLNQCARCHGTRGEGLQKDETEWQYPPVFGNRSFNTGAGMFRLSRLAGFVKVTMPYDLAYYGKSVLSDEEAWDVAAYICSMPRPSMDISHDWPDILLKPLDHPFGPYADHFSELQHKYGPYGEIRKAKKN